MSSQQYYKPEAKSLDLGQDVKPSRPVSNCGVRNAISEVRLALDEAEEQLADLCIQLDPISIGGQFSGNTFEDSVKEAVPSKPANPLVSQLDDITARIHGVSRRLRAATNLLNEQL